MAETNVHHPIFSRFYTRLSRGAETKLGVEEHRKELLAGLGGVVIEVGAGNGLNFAQYPATVAEVIAVEPEPHLRKLALVAAAAAPVAVEVMDGIASRLPVADASCDAGVVSLVLCSVPSQTRALAELTRVIKPGGELRFYEHVVGQDPKKARWQRRVSPVWSFFAGGCHPARDTAAAIEKAGFTIEEIRRFSVGPERFNVASPHILGRARRP
jgi:ubiquinone/menaquinone biosynthesis C-methylase UbiE